MTGRVKCEFCPKTFAKAASMRRHAKEFHFAAAAFFSSQKSKNKPLSASHSHSRFYMECPICRITGTKEELMEHYSEEHSIECVRKSLTFESFQEFERWKEQMEKETTSQFVKPKSAQVRKDGSQRVLYYCSRNGYSSSVCTKRNPRQNGSAKIQGYCPAALVVIVDAAGTVSVDHLTTHVGHALDLKFIRLTNQEKIEIARKIAMKIPHKVILDDIRDSHIDNNLQRLHLINKQDLSNIERSFNLLNPHKMHACDYVSVDSWVEEMRPSGLIRFYKGQQQRSDNVLKREDFFLAIASEHQLDMLKKYGPKCISINGTQGLNAYGYELTTVMVLDELNEGFPAAFLISNRTDDLAMQLFFEVMAEAIGNDLETKTFMSDMVDSYYNGWTKVFPRPLSRLFFSSQVDQAWRKNLKKISDTSRQEEVYEELKILEASYSFEKTLETLTLKMMNDPELRDFGEYFNKEFGCNGESWGLCFRQHTDINAHMHIERMLKTLKYIYLHASNARRLDRALDALIKFTRDKAFGSLTFSVKGKESSKLMDLQRRHRTAVGEGVNFVVVEAGYGVWECSSSTETCRIVKNDVKPPCACPLRCDACKACIHSFICSCLDSSVKWNMCKHIHYLCSRTVFSSHASNDEPESTDEATERIISEDSASQEVGTLVENAPKESGSSITNLEEYKKKLLKIWENIRVELMTATSIEQLQIAEHLMNPIIPTLRALKQPATVEFNPSTSNKQQATASSNKRKIETTTERQPTRKKKKNESNETTSKPTFGNQQNIPPLRYFRNKTTS